MCRRITKKRIFGIGLIGATVWLIITAWYTHLALPTFLGFTAKTLCSGVFVSDREPPAVLADIAPVIFVADLVTTRIDFDRKTVSAGLLGLFDQTALFRSGCGCTLIVGTTAGQLHSQTTECDHTTGRAGPLPSGHPWPMGRHFDRALIPEKINLPLLQETLNAAFSEPIKGRFRQTRAIVVVHDGRLIAERYAPEFDADTPFPGWSMSKSIVNALVGILVYQGRLRLHAPAPVPEWQGPDDARRQITLNHLLRMTSGLKFSEVYTPPSDVTDMLFRSHDFAAYAAAQRLEAPPGRKWHYSSGTSNILARIIRRTVTDPYGSVADFARQELFAKLNLTSTVFELDPSATFVGSSYMFATARDWARFGLLYLRDGVVNNHRVLPKDWLRYTRTPAPVAPKGKYGAHFWLNAGEPQNPQQRLWPGIPADTFYAQGFQGQSMTIIPSHKLVVVRLGLTLRPDAWDYEHFIKDLLTAIPADASS